MVMHRREFLSARQVARFAGHALGAAQEVQSAIAESSSNEFALLRFARRAMATQFEVLLPFGADQALAKADEALNEIDRLEDQLSVYRADSELSRLNRRAADAVCRSARGTYVGPASRAGPAVPVEAGLFDLLRLAARVSRETEGAFDITAGALIKTWGFYRGPRRVPTKDERFAALERVGMRHVVLDPAERTVRYLRSGLEINLGSIGKGYALDRAAELLRSRWNVQTALLHGGQSSFYAIGSEPGTARGWSVGIRHPWIEGSRLAIVHLQDRALGTSAATYQHLEWQGRKLGHILDPRTGWPAENLASATAIAPTAAEADALATAFYILGADKTRAYCASHPGIGAILLPPGESAKPVPFGLAPDEFSLIDA